MSKIKTICAYCGASIIKQERKDKVLKNRYCSRECMFNHRREGNLTYRNCLECNKEFVVSSSHLNSKKCCSRECSKIYNNRKYYKEVNCDNCNKKFTRYISLSTYHRRNNKNFCCKECYYEYRSFIKYDKKINPTINYRVTAFKHFDKICTVCGWKDIPDLLDVHHIDFNRSNNDISNLIPLCPNCHAMVSRGYAEIIDKKMILLETKKYGKHFLNSRYIDIFKERINILNNSGIDPTQFGSAAKLAKLWDLSHASARNFIIRYQRGDYDFLK